MSVVRIELKKTLSAGVTSRVSAWFNAGVRSHASDYFKRKLSPGVNDALSAEFRLAFKSQVRFPAAFSAAKRPARGRYGGAGWFVGVKP